MRYREDQLSERIVAFALLPFNVDDELRLSIRTGDIAPIGRELNGRGRWVQAPC